MSKSIEPVKPVESGIAPLSDSGATGAGGEAPAASGEGAPVLGSGEGLFYPDGKPYKRPTEEEYRKAGYTGDYAEYFAKYEAELAEKMAKKGAKAAKSSEKPKEELDDQRALYHVVGPGSVVFRGEMHAARSLLRLTEAEAEDLGEAVKPGKPPPSKAQVGARKAGVYVVAGPGSVGHGGKFHEPGALLDLSEADARSLGGAIKEVE
ncbi:MAG TPA: hypothetical protein VG734_25970 [Lacunisphaera sp.]|nr:hypothetical protein [Lacunisphaera sp.]